MYEFKIDDEVINTETFQRGIVILVDQKYPTEFPNCIVKFPDGSVQTLETRILKPTGVQQFVKDKADRHNTGKPQLSYLLDFPNALEEFAFICAGGTIKYDKHNWKKDFPFSELEDSLLRHLEKFHNCEDRDVESKRLHLGHVMWNAMALIEGYNDEEIKEKFDNRDHKIAEN